MRLRVPEGELRLREVEGQREHGAVAVPAVPGVLPGLEEDGLGGVHGVNGVLHGGSEN